MLCKGLHVLLEVLDKGVRDRIAVELRQAEALVKASLTEQLLDHLLRPPRCECHIHYSHVFERLFFLINIGNLLTKLFESAFEAVLVIF